MTESLPPLTAAQRWADLIQTSFTISTVFDILDQAVDEDDDDTAEEIATWLDYN